MPKQRNLVAVICYALGPLMFGVLPVAVNGFHQRLGFSLEQAGYIASIDLVGLFVGQILTASIIRSVSSRKLAMVACALFVIGNFLTAFATTFYLLAVIRFLCEIGGGIFIALCMTYLTRSKDPDRYIGLSVGLQLMLTIVLLLLSPYLLESIGLKGFFLVLAGISMVSLLSVVFPLDMEFADQSAFSFKIQHLTPKDKGALVGVLSILVYWIGIGALWSFLEVIGVEKGFSKESISNSLALTQFAGFSGAIFTAWLGSKLGRLWPTLICLGLQVVCMLALSFDLAITPFGITIALFSFTWNMILIYQLAMVAKLDSKGVFMSIGTSAQALGVAIGPTIISLTLINGTTLPVVITMIVSIILCAFLSVVISRHARAIFHIEPPVPKTRRNIY